MDFGQQSFTSIRERGLDSFLAENLSAMADEIRNSPDCRGVTICLGGGYGRGEGGVYFSENGKPELYNDLDFFVFTGKMSRNLRARADIALGKIAEKWERIFRVSVDFAPARELSSLKKVGRTLMFQELRHGYRILCGDCAFADCLPDLAPEELPWIEAVRLLMNRGMGLLFAGEHLRKKSQDTGFILRNLNKAVLGSGDALLLSTGQYRWRGEERVALFPEVVRSAELSPIYSQLYREAWQFKQRPDNIFPADPSARWRCVRDFWSAAVRRVAGTEEKTPSPVRVALHKGCVEHGESNLYYGLKRLLKTRRADFSRTMPDAPSSVILAELYALLSGADCYPLTPRSLYRAWEKFN